jgi:hypothetical protein
MKGPIGVLSGVPLLFQAVCPQTTADRTFPTGNLYIADTSKRPSQKLSNRKRTIVAGSNMLGSGDSALKGEVPG